MDHAVDAAIPLIVYALFLAWVCVAFLSEE